MLGLTHCVHAVCSLSGILPDQVGKTGYLVNVVLSNNSLQGTFPTGLASSSQVTTLDLSLNQNLIGSLPDMR